MSGVYKSMLMGRTSSYYVNLLKIMYEKKKNDSFLWNEFTVFYPEINKSTLSKLKSANFIVKNKNGKGKIQTWKLHPEVKQILEQKKVI